MLPSMPPLPPVPGGIRCHLKWTVGADVDVLPGFFFSYSGTAPTAAQLNTLCEGVFGEVGSLLKAYWVDAYLLTEVIMEDISSDTGAGGTYSGSTAGTSGYGGLAAGSAFVLNFEIDRRYRGGKPKIFLPLGGFEVISSPQLWTGAFVTDIVTAWNDLITYIGANMWADGVFEGQINVSYYKGFLLVTNPITGRGKNVPTLRMVDMVPTPTIDAIASVSGNQRIGSQRRRNGKSA